MAHLSVVNRALCRSTSALTAGFMLIAGAGIAPALGTEVYRWVGDDGAIHFGDRPPTGRTTERVEVHPPMGAIPFPNAEEILRRPVRPATETAPDQDDHPGGPTNANAEDEDEYSRDRRSRRGR